MSRPRNQALAAVALEVSSGAACGRCLHWCRVGDDNLGQCRRHPPAHVHRATEFGPLVVYGVTRDIDLACGEYKQRR